MRRLHIASMIIGLNVLFLVSYLLITDIIIVNNEMLLRDYNNEYIDPLDLEYGWSRFIAFALAGLLFVLGIILSLFKNKDGKIHTISLTLSLSLLFYIFFALAFDIYNPV